MQQKYRFKHLFGEQSKDNIVGIKPTQTTCDSCLIKGNSKYMAFSYQSGGGGILCVLDYKKKGKVNHEQPMIKGHSATVLDFDFFPFIDNYVATCSADATIKIWKIPEEFNADLNQAEQTLSAHTKKVNQLSFNITSEGVLASSSYDYTIKIWDIQKGLSKLSIGGPSEYAQSLEWNYNGSLLGTTWKDKFVRVIDPRQQKIAQEAASHEGGKPQRFCWLGNKDVFFSVGFSKNIDREFKVWDIKNMDKPITTTLIDKASGILYPYFDSDLEIMYLAGKGDGNIRYYEYTDGQFINYLNDFRSPFAAKGYGFMQKYCLDVKKNEVAKFLKLTDNSIDFISFIQPRKAECFQEDLYPDCDYDTAQSADSWFGGNTTQCKKRSMRPNDEDIQPQKEKQIQFIQQQKPISEEEKKAQQFKQLSEENATLKIQVIQQEEDITKKQLQINNLKKQLEESGGQQKQKKSEQLDLDNGEMQTLKNENSQLKNELESQTFLCNELQNKIDQYKEQLENYNDSQKQIEQNQIYFNKFTQLKTLINEFESNLNAMSSIDNQEVQQYIIGLNSQLSLMKETIQDDEQNN